MLTWGGLFRQIDRLDPAERRVAAERAEFERWAVSAEQRAMDEFARVATRRSRETFERTRATVEVLARLDAAAVAPFGGAHRLVALSLCGSSVDVYSVRSPGESPTIHFACERAATGSRFPVIVTVPGCLVVRSGRADMRLLTLPGRTPTTADALVLRAFGLLFGALESVSTSQFAKERAPR